MENSKVGNAEPVVMIFFMPLDVSKASAFLLGKHIHYFPREKMCLKNEELLVCLTDYVSLLNAFLRSCLSGPRLTEGSECIHFL